MATRRPAKTEFLLPAAPGVTHVSSRLVREVHRAGGDISVFVPEVVARFLAPRPDPGTA